MTRTNKWLCSGCKAWRERYPGTAGCRSCGQTVAVDGTGSCRLCRKQRSMIARQAGRRARDVDLVAANARGQQLFFAVGGMLHVEGHGKVAYRKKTVPADMALLRPVAHRQMVLLDLPRDIRAGLRGGFPPAPDPALEAALHQFVRDHAARYGWKQGKAEKVQRGIRIMLGIQDTPGAAIRRSDVALLSAIKHSAAVVADVLAAAGMLQEDREPAIIRWFTVQVAQLPQPMRDELGVWLQVMRSGSTTPPRMHPRSEATIRSQLSWALPALRTWAHAHPSLREIGRDDVLAALPATGSPRATTIQGLRSIFRILKGRKLVFINPTSRISVPTPDKPIPAPVDLAALRQALNSANPTEALLTSLLAFHAIRLHQLARIRLTDLHDGRLHIGEQTILLADLVRRRVDTYLRFRHRTWPDCINPYLFVHVRNVGTDRHVTTWWIRHQMSIAGQQIRQDRILHEAHANGGDVRALCDLFGLSVASAYRYGTVIDRIVDPRTSPTSEDRNPPTGR